MMEFQPTHQDKRGKCEISTALSVITDTQREKAGVAVRKDNMLVCDNIQ